MYVRESVPECDITGKKYEANVQGAYAVAQGATGRWCCVMYIGPEYLAERGLPTISRDEAYALIEKQGGWAEF